MEPISTTNQCQDAIEKNIEKTPSEEFRVTEEDIFDQDQLDFDGNDEEGDKNDMELH